jgi:hypothetical protein
MDNGFIKNRFGAGSEVDIDFDNEKQVKDYEGQKYKLEPVPGKVIIEKKVVLIPEEEEKEKKPKVSEQEELEKEEKKEKAKKKLSLSKGK